jgi:hypothetical protein
MVFTVLTSLLLQAILKTGPGKVVVEEDARRHPPCSPISKKFKWNTAGRMCCNDVAFVVVVAPR